MHFSHPLSSTEFAGWGLQQLTRRQGAYALDDNQGTCKRLLGVVRLCHGRGLRVLGLLGTGADEPHLNGGLTVAVQHNPAGSNSMSTG